MLNLNPLTAEKTWVLRIIMKNWFLLTFLILQCVSCGTGGGSSSTSFNVTMGAAITGTVNQNGGLVIVGRNNTTNESIALGYRANEDMRITLSNGLWEFAAVGWAGEPGLGASAQIFTGENRCGYSGLIELGGGDVNVNLTLNKNNCSQTFADGEKFAAPSYIEPIGQFKKMLLRSCLHLPGTISGTSCDGAGGSPVGLTQSYQIVLGAPSSPEFTHKKALSSSCQTINPATASDIRLPYGNLSGSPFTIKILSFSEPSCSGNPVVYEIKDGLFKGQTIPNMSVKTDSTIYSNEILTLLVHNPDSIQVTDPLFGFGNYGDQTITSSTPNIAITDYYKITNINALDSALITLDSTTGLNPYDEVVWYVNGQNNGGCNDFIPGLYGLSRVKDVIDGTQIRLTQEIENYKEVGGGQSLLTLPSAGNLSLAPGSANYCSIQLIKVPHYRNLTFDSTTAAINFSAPAFDYANGKGGVFISKVSGKLKTMGANTISLNMTEKGRLDSYPMTYPACPAGMRCAKMGNGLNSAVRGGGVALIYSKDVELLSPMTVEVSGNALDSEGGSLIIRSQNITDSSSGSILYIKARGGTNSGNGGLLSIHYCQSITGFSGYSQDNFATGGTGPTQNDTNFCL